jgi:hypothetical protein
MRCFQIRPCNMETPGASLLFQILTGGDNGLYSLTYTPIRANP